MDVLPFREDNSDFSDSHVKSRKYCSKCFHPQTTCYCDCLPKTPLRIKTFVLILQHPFEEARKIRTARMLQLSISDLDLKVVISRRYNQIKTPEIMPIIQSKSAFLLYPKSGSAILPDFAETYQSKVSDYCISERKILIIIDGTWNQARQMINENECLRDIQKFQLPSGEITGHSEKSEYRIRRQPIPNAVSTVEAVARALDYWEGTTASGESFSDILLKPLRRMVYNNTKWMENDMKRAKQILDSESKKKLKNKV